MLMSKTRWNVQNIDQQKVQDLADQLKVTNLVASLLVNRGIETERAARFFLFDEGQVFHDPFLMNDMDVAVERIKKAIREKERIIIYGDYDADGVSSTAVLLLTLRQMGANAYFYIPNRFTEGYGPNEAAFRKIGAEGVSLIITVDTGVSARHEAEVAKELGIDLIITDHHEPGEQLPDALAIIHPSLGETPYPFPHLAGVGVAFKLAHALLGERPDDLLDLVAIGTIADLVSLTGENRYIAKQGLEKLRQSKRSGLLALLQSAGIRQEEVDEEKVGFGIAPRLNAVGRLGQADLAVDILLTEDRMEAEAMAGEIEEINKERQEIVKEITEAALVVAEAAVAREENVLVVAGEGWNAGVIGIVASRLADRFYRPVVVLSLDKETGLAKGSARSIVGFDLFQSLTSLKEILPHFGGHPMAAGMTLKIADIDEFRRRLNDLAANQLSKEDFLPITEIDAVVALADVSIETIEQMNLLAPFGMDNSKPKVLIEGVDIHTKRKIGTERNHLKMLLESGDKKLDSIGFHQGHLYEQISPQTKVNVLGELAINEWNNERNPQIFIRDVSIDSWQLFDMRNLKKHESLSDLVPSDNRKWIIFKESTREKVDIPGDEVVHYVDSMEAAREISLDGNVVFADLPSSYDLFCEVIKGKAYERIYTCFYKEDSAFFSTMPTRDHFKWYFAFLQKKGPFDLNIYSSDLAKYRGWTLETIDFMSKVFLELEFVTIQEGIISLLPEQKKRDLTESPTYKEKQMQYTLEKELLYASHEQLKEMFASYCHGAAHTEEEKR